MLKHCLTCKYGDANFVELGTNHPCHDKLVFGSIWLVFYQILFKREHKYSLIENKAAHRHMVVHHQQQGHVSELLDSEVSHLQLIMISKT